MAYIKKVASAPDLSLLETFSESLTKNGFVVLGETFESEKVFRPKARLALGKARAVDSSVLCAVWFVRADDSESMYVEVLPSEKELVSATLNCRRRDPHDLFEAFRVETALQAPMYGLASLLAQSLNISAVWLRDSAVPMKLSVTKIVPMTEDEITEFKAKKAQKKKCIK